MGGFAVVGAVVDEEGLVGGGLLALEHHLEDGWRGLHQSALVAEVEVVEVVVDGVVAAIKVWRARPLHHIGVGVREQTDFVALCAKVNQRTLRVFFNVIIVEITKFLFYFVWNFKNIDYLCGRYINQ